MNKYYKNQSEYLIHLKKKCCLGQFKLVSNNTYIISRYRYLNT